MKYKTTSFVYLISSYLIPILQVMNVKYEMYYRNNLITSKCLNTAVMLTILLVGSNKLSDIQYCDVSNTVSRHKSNFDDNQIILKKVMKSLLHNNKTYSTIYYIMLTDGNLRDGNITSTNTEYFPGHVFLIEKTAMDNGYHIYQSFIKEYNLNGFLNTNKCRTYKKTEVANMCTYFEKFLSKDYIWDTEAVEQWYKLTGVDTSKFRNYYTDNIFLCYKTFKMKTASRNIIKFVNEAINDVKDAKSTGNYLKYDSTHYMTNNLSAKPLDINQLHTEFKKLRLELNKYKDK